MSDERLRIAERAYRAAPSEETYCAWVAERLRFEPPAGFPDRPDLVGWDCVFADLAGSRASPNKTDAPPGEAARDVFLADVERVLASAVGENDGPDWLALVVLHGGEFAYVSAGCDYTGWG